MVDDAVPRHHMIAPGSSPGQWVIDGVPAEIIMHQDLVQIIVDLMGGVFPAAPERGGLYGERRTPKQPPVRTDTDRLADIKAVLGRWKSVPKTYTHIKITTAASDIQNAIR